VTDEVLRAVARQVTGKLGQKTGIAPRLFLKKLVDGVLDRVDQWVRSDSSGGEVIA
jgi:hypothetical protein